VALHYHLDGAQPVRRQPVERLAGRHEWRPAERPADLAAGTLACPDCDAPVLPAAGGVSPRDPISCGFCSRIGAVRDFLSLAEPTRPTRVAVRVRLPLEPAALRAAALRADAS
jgi:hypothetical protein